MLRYAAFLALGALCCLQPISASIGLTELTAEDAAVVLRDARPGVDYPIFDSIPITSFNCHAPNIEIGVRYADAETGCQVFHVCDELRNDRAYLCPNKTIFNDQSQVCEWFHQVDCSQVYKRPITTTIITSPAQTVQTPIQIDTIQTPIKVETKPDCDTTSFNTVPAQQTVYLTESRPSIIYKPISAVQPALIKTDTSSAFKAIQSSVRAPRPLGPAFIETSYQAKPYAEFSAPAKPLIYSSAASTDKDYQAYKAAAANYVQPAPVSAVKSDIKSAAINYVHTFETPASAVKTVPAAAVITQEDTLETNPLASLQNTGLEFGSFLQDSSSKTAARPILLSQQQVAAPANGELQFSGTGIKGLGDASSFFNPFAAYGNGIVSTFFTPLTGSQAATSYQG